MTITVTLESRLVKRYPDIEIWERRPQGKISAKALLVLPGILSRWEEQAGPILDTIARGRVVFGVQYIGESWNAGNIVAEVSEYMNARGFLEVELFGVSIGGMIIPEIAHAIHRSTRPVVATIIDAPFGACTLVPLPSKLRWIFTRKVYRIIPNRLGNRILNDMVTLPHDENIEIPIEVERAGNGAVDAYRASIKGQARKALSGHKWSMWGSQMAYMVTCRPHVELLYGVPTRYYACVSDKNETVAQPEALLRWRVLPSIKVIEVDTAHAAFLEAAPTWHSVFSD